MLMRNTKGKATDIFDAIKSNDFEKIKRMVEAQPELAKAIAPKKPTETMGMSPLQVALNTGWHRESPGFCWRMVRMSTIWPGLNINCTGAVWVIQLCLTQSALLCGTPDVMYKTNRRESSDGFTPRMRLICHSDF